MTSLPNELQSSNLRLKWPMLRPYEDELLSCTLARTARRARQKPHLLAKLAFGSQTACHPQFPKEIPQLLANMRLPEHEWERMVWEHTSYPLIEPFLSVPQRHRLLCWLRDDCAGLGRPGAKIFNGILFQKYRYCPKCFEEQLDLYGEMYWKRIWQIPECHICQKHKIPLRETTEYFRDWNTSVSRKILPTTDSSVKLLRTKHDELIVNTLKMLLERRWRPPGKAELLHFYEELTQGISPKTIHAAARSYWGDEWLENHQIHNTVILLRGNWWQSWWMHLTLIKALLPNTDLASVMAYASQVRVKLE